MIANICYQQKIWPEIIQLQYEFRHKAEKGDKSRGNLHLLPYGYLHSRLIPPFSALCLNLDKMQGLPHYSTTPLLWTAIRFKTAITHKRLFDGRQAREPHLFDGQAYLPGVPEHLPLEG